MKIMIIDDDSIIINSYRLILEKYGYKKVEFVMDGSVALDRIKEFKPDIIWLDMKMPKINGLYILRKLKTNAKTKDSYVVIHSVYAMRNDIKKCLDLGADSFLPKPIDVGMFINEIKKVETLKANEKKDEKV